MSYDPFNIFDSKYDLGNGKGGIMLPYFMLASIGRFPDARTFFFEGRDPSAPTGEIHDLWPGGEHPTDPTHLFHFPTAASLFSVASDAEADIWAGPAGASAVFVEFLNENWDWDTEEIKLNGVTPVSSTKKMIRMLSSRISRSKILGGSDTPIQAGNISIRHIDDDALMDFMYLEAGIPSAGQGQAGRVSIPRGYIGFLTYLSLNAVSNKETSFFMEFESGQTNELDGETFGPARRTIALIEGLSQPFLNNLAFNPFPLPPISDLWMTAVPTAAATTSVIGAVLMLKMDNNLVETGTGP